VLLFVISAVLAGPLAGKLIESEEKDTPGIPDVVSDNDLEADVETEKDAEAKKVAEKKKAAGEKKDDKKKAAAGKAATSKKKKSVEAVEMKKVSDQIKDSSKKIQAANRNRTKKINPVTVGCYSAVASNLMTLGFIILIAVVWYFGCIRHGRCCCMCCYNKAGRCCCACSCCDGYIDKDDEEMIIARGDKPEYDSVEK